MAYRAVRLRDATGYEAHPVGLHLLDLAFGDPPAILDAGLPGPEFRIYTLTAIEELDRERGPGDGIN